VTRAKTEALAEEVSARHAPEPETSLELRHERATRLLWRRGARVVSLRGQNAAFPALDTPEAKDRGE
jgi:hypothetical protein